MLHDEVMVTVPVRLLDNVSLPVSEVLADRESDAVRVREPVTDRVRLGDSERLVFVVDTVSLEVKLVEADDVRVWDIVRDSDVEPERLQLPVTVAVWLLVQEASVFVVLREEVELAVSDTLSLRLKLREALVELLVDNVGVVDADNDVLIVTVRLVDLCRETVAVALRELVSDSERVRLPDEVTLSLIVVEADNDRETLRLRLVEEVALNTRVLLGVEEALGDPEALVEVLLEMVGVPVRDVVRVLPVFVQLNDALLVVEAVEDGVTLVLKE